MSNLMLSKVLVRPITYVTSVISTEITFLLFSNTSVLDYGPGVDYETRNISIRIR